MKAVIALVLLLGGTTLATSSSSSSSSESSESSESSSSSDQSGPDCPLLSCSYFENLTFPLYGIYVTDPTAGWNCGYSAAASTSDGRCPTDLCGLLSTIPSGSNCDCRGFFACPVNQRQLNEKSQEYHEPDDEETLSIPMENELSVIGFVRVPKTGSTTVLRFMQASKRIYPWPLHLSSYPENSKGESKPHLLGPTSCVFGHVPTTAHLGKNYGTELGNLWNRCPHIPYAKLMKNWNDTLDLWSPPDNAVYAESAERDSFSFSYKSFSMVREPFDRLVSYFYYLTKFVDTNQFLKHTATKAQYDRVKAHDLVGWMELLHIEGGGCGLELPYQYKYFHEDVEKAIALIREGKDGNSSKIFTVINECFEASLYLLTDAFPGFDAGVVEAFIQSDDFVMNDNKKAYKKVSKVGLKSLREKAKIWFADDYKFYNAVVDQFKDYLAASKLDSSYFEQCTFWVAGEEDSIANA